MLESRSAYGWYGLAGGYTGENAPFDEGTTPVNMPYREYKTRYPGCKTLGDYDKLRKTITVLIPLEVTERANFGNRYRMNYYCFATDLKHPYNPIVEVKAKCYKNALRNVKAWAKRDGFSILGDAEGHELQRNW